MTIEFNVEINTDGYLANVSAYHIRKAIAEYFEVTGMRPEHVTVTPVTKIEAGTLTADRITTSYTVGAKVHRKGSGRIGTVTRVKASGLLDVLWNPDRVGQQHETFNLDPSKVEFASNMKILLTSPKV